MNQLPEFVTVHWFRYNGKILVYGKPKHLSGPISPSSEEGIQFRKTEERASLVNKEGVVKLTVTFSFCKKKKE